MGRYVCIYRHIWKIMYDRRISQNVNSIVYSIVQFIYVSTLLCVLCAWMSIHNMSGACVCVCVSVVQTGYNEVSRKPNKPFPNWGLLFGIPKCCFQNSPQSQLVNGMIYGIYGHWIYRGSLTMYGLPSGNQTWQQMIFPARNLHLSWGFPIDYL